MELNINDLTKSDRELEVTLEYDEFKNDLETEVKKQTKNIQLPGFRKGKVPLQMIKKMYGDALEYEASEKVANSQFWKIVKDKNLNPIGQPTLTDIKFNPGSNLYFKVKYEVYPEIEVKDYTGIEIEVPELKVKDEDVQHEIEHVIKNNSTTKVEDAVGDTDNFIIKVEFQRVTESGEPFEGSKAEVIDVDLSNPNVQADLRNNAKGKKVGETFSFSFEDERKIKNQEGNEETVKEKYLYSGKVLEVKKIILPELSEELIKKVSKDKVSTEAEFREEIRKNLQAYFDERTDEFVRDKLLKEIVKNNEFTPPSTLVNNVLDDMVKREEEEAKKYGVKKINRQEIIARLEPSAVMEVKWFLIKRALEQKENLSVSDDELKELAEKDAEKTGLPVDKLINYYKSSNYTERFVDKKLFDLLKEKNTIKKVDPEKFSKKEKEENK